MADHHTPTVIQPDIPAADLTWLERLILGAAFETEPAGEGLYFFSRLGPAEVVSLPIAQVREALAASAGRPSRATEVVAELLDAAASDEEDLEIDFAAVLPWAAIFQDVLQRSASLRRITAVSSFTCSPMRPDGFGGMVVLITARQILSRDTGDLLAELHALADRHEAEGAGAAGVHVLLQLSEAAVRAAAQRMVAANPGSVLAPADVTETDVRIACLTVAEWNGRAEDREAAEHAAALLVISGAARRLSGPA